MRRAFPTHYSGPKLSAMPESSLTIAVDFHGVIVAHPEGSQGATQLDWPEVPGAIAWLKRISERYFVHIISARFGRPHPEGDHARAMAMTWLSQHGIPSDWMMPSERSPSPRIWLTAVKPACILWVDDRGWRFDGTFPTVEQIQDFRPWNR